MTIILIHSVLVHGEEILGVNGQLIDKQINKIPQTGETTNRRTYLRWLVASMLRSPTAPG